MIGEMEVRILDELEKLKKEIQATQNEFNYVTDTKLMESYIYKMEYLNRRYDYFLNLAKEKRLKAFK